MHRDPSIRAVHPAARAPGHHVVLWSHGGHTDLVSSRITGTAVNRCGLRIRRPPERCPSEELEGHTRGLGSSEDRPGLTDPA